VEGSLARCEEEKLELGEPGEEEAGDGARMDGAEDEGEEWEDGEHREERGEAGEARAEALRREADVAHGRGDHRRDQRQAAKVAAGHCCGSSATEIWRCDGRWCGDGVRDLRGAHEIGKFAVPLLVINCPS
jgi:hypothetical protein